MLDRTTKLLLALLVLGIWALLLRPALTPVPVRAQQASTLSFPGPMLTINPVSGVLYLAPPDGNVYLFDPNTLQLRARAVYVPPTFVPKTGRQEPATFVNPALP
jgi:hypothetical protein